MLITDRYGHHHFKIDLNTYQKILEMITFYDQSIYYFPDEEVIEATGADPDNLGEKVTLKVNEIVFED